MLYRPAETPNPAVWDAHVEHRVFDEAEVERALGEGWARHPNDLLSQGEQSLAEPDPGAQPVKRKGRPPKEA